MPFAPRLRRRSGLAALGVALALAALPAAAQADLWSVQSVTTAPSGRVVAGTPFTARVLLSRVPDVNGAGPVTVDVFASIFVRPAGRVSVEPAGALDCAPWELRSSSLWQLACSVPKPASPPASGVAITVRLVADVAETFVVSTALRAETDTDFSDDSGSVEVPAVLPPLVPGRTQLLTPVNGTILVRRPGDAGFLPLGLAGPIPNGTEVDATAGTTDLTVAAAGTRRRETVRTTAGRFRIRQGTRRGDPADLVLSEPLSGCPAPGAARAAAGPTRRTLRTFVRRRGRFRTRGRYASALVRGTRWTTTDSCAGTAIAVQQGTVSVFDYGRRRTVLVPAGARYLATPRQSAGAQRP